MSNFKHEIWTLLAHTMHANHDFVTLIDSIAVTIGADKETQLGGALFVGPFLAQLALHPHLSGLALSERLAANDTWPFILIAALDSLRLSL